MQMIEDMMLIKGTEEMSQLAIPKKYFVERDNDVDFGKRFFERECDAEDKIQSNHVSEMKIESNQNSIYSNYPTGYTARNDNQQYNLYCPLEITKIRKLTGRSYQNYQNEMMENKLSDSEGSNSPATDPMEQMSPEGLSNLLNLLDIQKRHENGYCTDNCTWNTSGSIIPVLDRRWKPYDPGFDTIERMVELHRKGCEFSDATHTWSGQLPRRVYKQPNYSCKVFLGGVPYDITEQKLLEIFSKFGNVVVQFPGKDAKNINARSSSSQKIGYSYIIFESEKCVRNLIQCCTNDVANGKLYIKVSSDSMKSKSVQVIPWIINDSNFVRCPSQRLDPAKTVFVGALHGMLTAEGLANVMNDLFKNVVYAGIDTDKHKYPIGSGRVTFSSQKSYNKAIAAGFIEIKCERFTKKIQVDPYLESAMCTLCVRTRGPVFCRNCLKYYCRACFICYHENLHHRPMMRNRRDN